MKLLEKGILLIGALVIVVTGVVLNNYLISKNSNNYKLYRSDGATSTKGILLNTKTGDAWYLKGEGCEYIKEEYIYISRILKNLTLKKDKKSNNKESDFLNNFTREQDKK